MYKVYDKVCSLSYSEYIKRRVLMKKDNKNNEFNRIQRFSIRKYSFGAASVAIATYLMFMGNGAVYAAQEE